MMVSCYTFLILLIIKETKKGPFSDPFADDDEPKFEFASATRIAMAPAAKPSDFVDPFANPFDDDAEVG